MEAVDNKNRWANDWEDGVCVRVCVQLSERWRTLPNLALQEITSEWEWASIVAT